MPKSLLTVEDHIQEIVDARSRTRSERFGAVDPVAERVTDVVTASCVEVARAFEPLGFRWSKSGLKFARKVGEFTHVVAFQRDGENAAGRHIGVSIHTYTNSAALAKWREDNGVTTGDCVWAAQIGYLPPTHEYLKWQLVDRDRRQAEIASMIATIHNRALPAFDVCSTRELLASRIMERPEITWHQDWSVDTAVWAGNLSAAAQLARSFLMHQPEWMEEFHGYLRSEALAPSASRPSDRLHCLAWAVRKHGLNLQLR
jgi:hypothetical protein